MQKRPLPRITVPHPHVRSETRVLGGSPHVAGSKVPVRRLWAWHRGGVSVETLFRRYPNLGPGPILDALSFSYDNPDVIQADIENEQAMLEKRAGGRGAPGAQPTTQLAFPFSDGTSKKA